MNQETEYTDIEMLECNSRSSVQYLGGDKSISSHYTNRLGRNIKLNRGDKVSVSYSFINERGCGIPDAIEINGIQTGDEELSIPYTDVENFGIQPDNAREKTDTTEYSRVTLKDYKFFPRDDEINVPINYYCNTNGEGYYFLPRRYLPEQPRMLYPTADDEKDKVLEFQKNIAYQLWTGDDSIANGRCYYERGKGGDEYSMCLADMIFFYDTTEGKDGYFKPRTDGGKFAILVKDKMVQNFQYNAESTTFWTGLKTDPALQKYHLYQEVLNLKLPKGYNSPENIADRLTEQIQEERPLVELDIEDNGEPARAQIYSRLYSTKTYKPFNCAGFLTNQKKGFDDFMASSNTLQAQNYDGSYQYIGCNRPDLFFVGREFQSYTEHHFVNNAITKDPHGGPVLDTAINTSLLYTKDNLIKLSNIFKIQGLYPELFVGTPAVFGGTIDHPDATFENSRFLHINRYKETAGNIGNDLGYDNYEDKGSNRASMPFFFKYDKSNEDKFTSGDDFNDLSYGFATRYKNGDDYYIALRPDLIGGIQNYIFEFDGNITAGTRQIGWDWHFNAYGIVCCQLYSGYTDYMYDDSEGFILASKTFNTTDNQNRYQRGVNLAPLVTQTYLGCNNGAVIYNEDGHFAFTQLHTAENVGQQYNAGDDNNPDSATYNPIVSSAGANAYKINKQLNFWSWTPEMKPYGSPSGVEALGVVSGGLKTSEIWVDAPLTDPAWMTITETDGIPNFGKIKYDKLNNAIVPYSIIDSQTGIILNLNQGITEDTINDSLLGILGFSWEQINPDVIDSSNNYMARISTKNQNKLRYITTNSEIVSTETKDFVVNRYGAVQYTTQITIPIGYEGWVNGIVGNKTDSSGDREKTGQAFRGSAYTQFPVIVQQTNSINISGELLPRRMINPYYCIRSDLLLGGNNFIGGRDGNSILPIIDVVNKENGDGDYYFSGDSREVTITNDMNISEITTQITNPDGKFSKIDNGSCVIYKIQRSKILDNTIIEQILQANQPKKSNKK